MKEKNYAVLNARLKKQYKELVREIEQEKQALFTQDLKRLKVAEKWVKFAQEDLDVHKTTASGGGTAGGRGPTPGQVSQALAAAAAATATTTTTTTARMPSLASIPV